MNDGVWVLRDDDERVCASEAGGDVTDRIEAPDSVRMAPVWRVLGEELDRREGDEPLRVLDVGGGTGGAAVWFARRGHHATVVDPSPNALAALRRRATDAGVQERVHAIQADVDALGETVAPGQMDVVLCHNVLEYVDDPRPAVAAIAGVLRAGGVASVLVANRAAAVLARASAGDLVAAREILTGSDGIAGVPGTGPATGLRRRYDPAEARALLVRGGLRVDQVHGIGVLPADCEVGEASAALGQERLAELERELADRPPYRDIAAQLHLLGRRT